MNPTIELPPGYRLEAFARLDSTNTEAKRQAENGAEAGLVVWAETQTAGRGRRGRTWISPEGGLYFSILLRPDCAPATGAQLSFVSALAVSEAVLPGLTEPDILALKWPNDVLLRGRKVAGILLESGNNGHDLEWLVVGIGLNIRDHPENTEYPATSLNAEGTEDAEPGTILRDILHAFDKWQQIWSRDGFAPVREAWLSRARGLGEEITVRLPDQTLHGVFCGLNPGGALRLDVPGEGERIISAGDVYFPIDRQNDPTQGSAGG